MARAVFQLSAASQRRAALCCTAVLALHGAALGWMARDRASTAGHSGAPVMMARLMAPAEAESQRDKVSASRPLPPAPPAPLEEDATASASAGPLPPRADPPDDAHDIDLNAYVPRRWLSVGPHPVAPVVLPFPASFHDRARYTAVLDLYIEADGRVGRVEFIGLPLPEVLEHAARRTFEQARFTPGEVDGRIVRSLIRVEVDFDNLGEG